MIDKIKRLIASLILLLCAIGVVSAQDRMNEFVVTIDESYNPMTIYSSYGATPNDGVVIINSSIPDLEFGIMSVAKERLRKVVPDMVNNRYLLIIQPNDMNYKQYTITMNADGFLRGKIDSVVVKAGLSTSYIVNPKYEVNVMPNTLGGHEYVDLGLPSGTLWATCNIGASKPSDYGNYYAWGEIWPKYYYSWENYIYACTDNTTQLGQDNDPSIINWGSGWYTPTSKQWEELKKRCEWIWLSKGCKVVGINGNSIFLPASGYCDGYDIEDVDSLGFYWSSSLSKYDSCVALYFVFDLGEYGGVYALYDNVGRYIGGSVRPVCSFQK